MSAHSIGQLGAMMSLQSVAIISISIMSMSIAIWLSIVSNMVSELLMFSILISSIAISMMLRSMSIKMQQSTAQIIYNMSGIYTKLMFLESRADDEAAGFSDVLRHLSQMIEEFNVKADDKWLSRWLREQFQKHVSAGFRQGCSMQSIRQLWKLLLTTAVERSLLHALQYQMEATAEAIQTSNEETTIQTNKHMKINKQTHKQTLSNKETIKPNPRPL